MDAGVRYSSSWRDPPAQRAGHGEKRYVFLANRDRKWRALRIISTRRAAVTNDIVLGARFCAASVAATFSNGRRDN